MICFPCCKINLGLNITAKRPDGFHDLESVFYPVNWIDSLEIETSIVDKMSLYGLPIEGNEQDNLVWKALKLLRKDFDFDFTQFNLVKNIPMGAGLGGGSANGSFALVALNNFYSLGISQQKLEEYAAILGSDCPFFIRNKPQKVSGRGEVLEDLNLDLSDYYIVLVNPKIHVNTGFAFSQIKPAKAKSSVFDIIEQPLENWKGNLKNDFELGVFAKHSEIGELKQRLYGLGAVYASMTGTGSSVYGIFNKPLEDITMFGNYPTWQGKLGI